ncbi:MAG: hypothetical protein VX792_08575 [Candidatus Latescibacterota bacterium]|nr:hypothetical protein [Candidatus Latescibacterota bacterium]
MNCISERTYIHYHALHGGGEEGEVAFYAAEEEVLHWRIEGEGAWQSETLKKGQWLRRSFSKRAR